MPMPHERIFTILADSASPALLVEPRALSCFLRQIGLDRWAELETLLREMDKDHRLSVNFHGRSLLIALPAKTRFSGAKLRAASDP